MLMSYRGFTDSVLQTQLSSLCKEASTTVSLSICSMSLREQRNWLFTSFSTSYCAESNNLFNTLWQKCLQQSILGSNQIDIVKCNIFCNANFEYHLLWIPPGFTLAQNQQFNGLGFMLMRMEANCQTMKRFCYHVA